MTVARSHAASPPGVGARSRALPVAAVAGLAFGIVAGIAITLTGGEAGADGEVEVAAAETPAPPPQPAAAAAPGDPADSEPKEAAPAPDPVERTEAKTPEPAAELPRATLRFAVEPRAVAGDVRITVDGQPVEGRSHELELPGGKREVTVVARASGYKRFRTRVTVDGDETVDIELEKRKRRNGKQRKGDKDRGGPTGPGGLIDL